MGSWNWVWIKVCWISPKISAFLGNWSFWSLPSRGGVASELGFFHKKSRSLSQRTFGSLRGELCTPSYFQLSAAVVHGAPRKGQQICRWTPFDRWSARWQSFGTQGISLSCLQRQECAPFLFHLLPSALDNVDKGSGKVVFVCHLGDCHSRRGRLIEKLSNCLFHEQLAVKKDVYHSKIDRWAVVRYRLHLTILCGANK